MFTTILLFLVVLSLLVFVHELGHFLMAKKMGMKVEEFGFGFPPRLFGVKKGDTIYSVNWIPLGGFVKIKGESKDDRQDADSFSAKPASQRLIVLVAGVTMNLFLAAVLLSIGFMIGLPSVIDETLPANARVRQTELTIMEVVETSPAANAGFVSGDSIVAIDEQTFETGLEARTYIAEHADESLSIQVKKTDGSIQTHALTSAYLEEQKMTGIGIAFMQTGLVSLPPLSAVVHGVSSTIEYTGEVVKAFVGIIKNLVISQQVGVELSGPVGIAVLTGQVAAMGFVYLLQFTALLSINLAVINILPFPALDGGRVLFLAIEKIRGRAVNEKFEVAVHNLGFLLLMTLVVLVTYQDFVTFGDQILGALKNIVSI